MATKSFFNEYAKALLTYSPEEIGAFYHAPMAVYSDNGVLLVMEQKEVTQWWEQGVKPYKKMGIAKAVPEVIAEKAVSKRITVATVKWTNYDDEGKKLAEETNTYILSEIAGAKKITGLIVTG